MNYNDDLSGSSSNNYSNNTTEQEETTPVIHNTSLEESFSDMSTNSFYDCFTKAYQLDDTCCSYTSQSLGSQDCSVECRYDRCMYRKSYVRKLSDDND